MGRKQRNVIFLLIWLYFKIKNSRDTVNCKMCNVGKGHSQHITKKKYVSGTELFCSHTDVTSYCELLVILYVWRLACTPYMNLPVAWEKFLQETNAVCFHFSSWVGNIVDWRVNDFGYTVMWSQIQLVSPYNSTYVRKDVVSSAYGSWQNCCMVGEYVHTTLWFLK
jgi:hypothetical protein